MVSNRGKIIFASVFAVCGFAAPAQANDWGGIYVGAHAGGGFADLDTEFTTQTGPATFLQDFAPGTLPIPEADDLDGILGGLQVGYNFQHGNFVFGPEVSFSGAGLEDQVTSAIGGLDDVTTTQVTQILTVTGRLGWTFDRFLVYAEGGYAGADVDIEVVDNGLPTTGALNGDSWQSGFVVGGGLEFLASPNIILGVEYNYIDLGSDTISAGGTDSVTGPAAIAYGIDTEVHTIAARVSWNFGRGFLSIFGL